MADQQNITPRALDKALEFNAKLKQIELCLLNGKVQEAQSLANSILESMRNQ